MSAKFFFFLFFIHFSVHAQVTYYEDIVPIIETNCLSCHSSDGIGPMPLTTYDEVVNYAVMIKYVTDINLMPPFKANSHKTQYSNERTLTDYEKKILAEWIETGLTKGENTIDQNKKSLLTIEENSLFEHTICMEESFEHYGIYYDQYQTFVLPTELNKEKYIKEIYFEPGNRKIVRSANLSIAPIGSSKKMDDWDPRYGFFAFGNAGFTTSQPYFYTWMPDSKTMPVDSCNYFIPEESEILLAIHYGPFGESQKDSSCVHFRFAEKRMRTIQNVPLIKTNFLKDSFVLQKNERKRISSEFYIPVDVKLKSITPLAHLLCRSWEVFAKLPDKNSISLLKIEDWDFNWKEKYIFQDEIILPAGTKIYASAVYDNTDANPFNPANPPHTMLKGQHMFDENFECFFEFVPLKNDSGFIRKTFTVSEKELNDLIFQTNVDDHYILNLWDLENLNSSLIEKRFFDKGSHQIQSKRLPKLKGRYCVTLENSQGIVDSWWFVIL